MDIHFIKKRITEQYRYISDVSYSNLPLDRKKELIISATFQLDYFERKLKPSGGGEATGTNNMKKYKKINRHSQLVILAMAWVGKAKQQELLIAEHGFALTQFNNDGSITIPTEDGELICRLNDFLILADGKFSISSEEAFLATYVEVEEKTEAPVTGSTVSDETQGESGKDVVIGAGSEEKYIGTKILAAIPMNLGDYNKLKGWTIPADENPEREGYKVTYPDGYVSWSPKEVFEESYRKTSGMNFGLALEATKIGKKVARAGWNGKGMFIVRQKGYPNGIECNKNTSEAFGIEEGSIIKVTPYLMMKAADGTLVTGWLASQTDMLADDWNIVE